MLDTIFIGEAMIGMLPVARLQRRRLVDDATRALREAILGGQLSAGARLRQIDLAAQLGISRTPVREALGRLQQEGLVDLLPGGGVRVAVLNLGEAVELYDLREVLDGLAARLAATRATAPSLARLETSLARMGRCLARGRARGSQWFPAHVAFHDEIFRASGNARLQALSAVVRLSIQRFHPLLLRTEHRLEDAYREHRTIYEAIAAREGGAAERLARAHIANAKAIVLKAMAQGARDGAVQA
jgi:DNA-binding GntR family transcriptional regulator